MTSDSPNLDRPAFKTPNPDELQSEETRKAVHDRYADQPEADLSDVDRISQDGTRNGNAVISDDKSATPADLQIGIVARSAD